MKVQLVRIADCPNSSVAFYRLTSALSTLGHEEVPVDDILVETPDQIPAAGYSGSPTILVDDRDLFPTDERTDQLSCRLYATPDGPAGVPTGAQIEDALRSRLG